MLSFREGTASSLPDLYKKAKASAALASVGHPGVSNTASPMHPSLQPAKGTEDLEASRDPLSHGAGASEPVARQAAVEDMFRSNRNQASIAASRHVSSSCFC